MREYEFRGKTKTTEGEKWVYGNYYKVKSFFDKEEAHYIRNDHILDNIIDSKTLGEYTGRKDVHGIKVYTGDIVKSGDEVGLVIFDNDYLGYFVNFEEQEPLYDVYVEIIGNIWDNPELLEGEKDE